MKARRLGQHYDQLDPLERFKLSVSAFARGDEAELERLAASCPRELFRMYEAAFLDRLELAREIVHVMLADLQRPLGKLQILHALSGPIEEPELSAPDGTVALLLEQIAECAAHAAVEKSPHWDHERYAAVKNSVRETGERLVAILAQIEQSVLFDAAGGAHGFARFCQSELELDPITLIDAFAPGLGGELSWLLSQEHDNDTARLYEDGLREVWRSRLRLPTPNRANRADTAVTRQLAPDAPSERATRALRPHPQAALVPAMDARTFAQFKADITCRGLLSALEITDKNIVLDGKERLRAASELGLETVPVSVVAPEDEVEHMLLCALERRQLTASQRAALAVELSSYRDLREQATKRRLANLRQNSPEGAELPPRGKTRDQAAAWAGVSPRTVQDAATVREHDPELFARVKAGELAADAAARRVRRALRDQQLPAPGPLPEGPFELVYADPPWQLGHPDSKHAPENHYPTLPLEEIKQLQVPAADDALLFLWAVNCLLPEALETISAWGFNYLTNLTWVKPSVGLGVWTRNRHELLLVARRGSIAPPEIDVRPDSVIEAARGRHSQKPAAFYELIERAYPHLAKLELFARTARPGWVAWGNQLPAAA